MASPKTTPNHTHRVVVLHGPEELLRRLHTKELLQDLEEHLGPIETLQLDGARTPIADVLDECRSMGLLQQHKLVIVDDADLLIRGKDEDDEQPADSGSEKRRILERYADNPSPDATLLLRARKWNRGKLDAKIKKIGAIIKCEELPPYKATMWVSKRCHKEHHIAIDDAAATKLVQRVGISMGKLDAELGKLAAVAQARTMESISPQLVDELVTATAQEQFWEVQQRLLTADPAVAVQGVRDALGPWKCDPVMVSWSMLDLARKAHIIATMAAQGEPLSNAAKAAKLWGPGTNPIIDFATSLSPTQAADLLAECAAMDTRFKTGQRDPVRWLEVQAISFASLKR
jgi:DNA polymerase III subunit delta